MSSLFPDMDELPRRGKNYIKPKGYAGTPGGGPKGEFCKTCKHYCRPEHHGKTYRKCGLVEWAHSRANDILAGSCACQFWRPQAGSEA